MHVSDRTRQDARLQSEASLIHLGLEQADGAGVCISASPGYYGCGEGLRRDCACGVRGEGYGKGE